ncbi:importin-7 isoform X1 [Strongylocentrotus purpuratus]|uniref:Importin N-terminal domain-containing protein n=1 Tax=Strongylocentrotus purpuratus TaxID=7668 RepID=A0A7M7P2P5_STRPU|nr:importin-7 isoform X1 [Strongylocentrotus purpuratus]
MDPQKLVEILQGTIHPELRETAEKQLDEVHKIIGFTPTLLCSVMEESHPFPVRQAGVIYLKNMVTQFWQQREMETPLEPIPFSIHENDKNFIRDNIIKAIISLPELLRVQLCVCLSTMLKQDYPGKWDGVVGSIVQYISSDDPSVWFGGFLAVYQLVKNYEFKQPEDRGPLKEAMKCILPWMSQRCGQCLPDASEPSVLLQKLILKIFYALIQYNLPQDLVSREVFTQWMGLITAILEQPIPPSSLEVDIDDRPELPWWKAKKWSLHILSRVFERYGSPGNVTKEYVKFSDWYLKSFSVSVLTNVLRILEQYRQKNYLAPRVMQLALNYLNTAVSHGLSWKVIKPHIDTMIQDVLFPLMCYTDEDDELWRDDPYEYIRLKFDVFEDFISPVTAAQTVLHSSASKRKEVLSKTMGFCLQVITEPTVDPRKKDGALHMIGTLAEILLKKKIYKDQMEQMLVSHIFPEFQSPHGYMRARANWVVHSFSEVKYRSEPNLIQALDLTRQCLVRDSDMPVRVESAFALQMLISSHDKGKELMQPHVKEVIEALLVVIRETENDDLTNVMQKLICTYGDEIIPIAVDITTHLADTFSNVINSDDATDDKAITAMGILNTIETILNVVEDKEEIVLELEKKILQVVGVVLRNHVIGEYHFYEEVFSLIFSMTCTHVSPPLWEVFYYLFETFAADGFDFFVEMMPALHNYVTTDPTAFVSQPKHLQIVYEMCKKVLTEETDEDAQSHAAKLLEVVLIQYKGQIDDVVPLFVELALARLTREVKTTELRQMCLQVVISALYYNPLKLLELLDKVTIPNTNEAVTVQFIKQWLKDTDCFLGLHDRKMCVLGMCMLLSLPNRPPVVTELANEFLPSLLLLFKGLKRAYECRANAEEEDSDEEEDDSDFEEDELESDEDEIDEDGAEYLERLEKAAADRNDDDDDDVYEETALEGYNTILDDDEDADDEYVVFKTIMQGIQANDNTWYNALTNQLTSEQQQELNDVVILADQRKAAAESKKIELAGGYKFANATVPASFNFGSGGGNIGS